MQICAGYNELVFVVFFFFNLGPLTVYVGGYFMRITSSGKICRIELGDAEMINRSSPWHVPSSDPLCWPQPEVLGPNPGPLPGPKHGASVESWKLAMGKVVKHRGKMMKTSWKHHVFFSFIMINCDKLEKMMDNTLKRDEKNDGRVI